MSTAHVAGGGEHGVDAVAERLTDCGPDGLDGSRGGFAQQVLEFGEDLFDGVQVWRILRQKEQLSTA